MSRTMLFNTVRPSVQSFAQDMERVLRLNDHKGGWEDMEYLDIHRRIEDEWGEMNGAIAMLIQHGPSPERLEAIIHEACDIANFAMFAAAKAHKEAQRIEGGP